jgi:ribosomal protein S18 acetylase RimI-like enzyme
MAPDRPASLDTVRALELHEAQAHARPPRAARDLGDAVLLHDPTDRDPFLNRVSGLRLPSDGPGFDRRLAEILALFAAMDRRPHVWPPAAWGAPPDLTDRLAADGFSDVGGTHWMVLGSPDALRRPEPTSRFRVRVLRLGEADRSRRRSLGHAIARVIAEAFAANDAVAADVEADLATTGPPWDACLVVDGDEPVAAGRRYTADGITYVSSIASLPRRRGEGYGALVTSTLVDDGFNEGATKAHLGVDAGNDRARRLYERVGFEVLGARVPDLLLR